MTTTGWCVFTTQMKWRLRKSEKKKNLNQSGGAQTNPKYEFDYVGGICTERREKKRFSLAIHGTGEIVAVLFYLNLRKNGK